MWALPATRRLNLMETFLTATVLLLTVQLALRLGSMLIVLIKAGSQGRYDCLLISIRITMIDEKYIQEITIELVYMSSCD